MNDADDAGYEDFLSDWYADRDRILSSFGEFWVTYTRVLQAAGMFITAYFEVADDRRSVFYDEFLARMSLTRAADVIKSIVDDLGEPQDELVRALRELARMRNRLAHDALDLHLEDPRRGRPELTRRRVFGSDDPTSVAPDELEAATAACVELQERLLGLLPIITRS